MFLSSCASLLSKNTCPVAISSEPYGAKVTIVNNKGKEVFVGRTPTSAKLKTSDRYMTGQSYKVSISKEGYKDRVAYIGTKVNGWYWGNILLGGVVFGMFIVDPLTGAMFKMNTERINVTLEKEGKDTTSF